MDNNQVDLNALFTPKKDQLIWIEGTGPELKTTTARWTVKLQEDGLIWLPNQEPNLPWEFRLHGNIIAAVPFTTVEDRLKNQRDSIDRMARHLADHCPQLMGVGECSHIGSS